MKRTAILTTATKLTPSLSLLLTFSQKKIFSAKILSRPVEALLPEFELYFCKKEDVSVSFDQLKFEKIHKKCIPIFKFLKKHVGFGQVITYGEIARKLGVHPRLVGYCMKINPFPVIIPCHRVVARNGLGGYSAGIEIKRALLRHEGIL